MKLYIYVHLPANEVRYCIEDLFRDKVSVSKPLTNPLTNTDVCRGWFTDCNNPYIPMISSIWCFHSWGVSETHSSRGLGPEDIKPERLSHSSARNKIPWTAATGTFLALWWYKRNVNIYYRDVMENWSLQEKLISFLDEIMWLSEE